MTDSHNRIRTRSSLSRNFGFGSVGSSAGNRVWRSSLWMALLAASAGVGAALEGPAMAIRTAPTEPTKKRKRQCMQMLFLCDFGLKMVKRHGQVQLRCQHQGARQP